ncbi:histidine phosphatase family protein [Butyrivibrio sp. INlla21]|uniref:histidine phosphatase family protein n=1 Tax=Butyrivibrio sp. INlla21 TaxID=1520811 RepID=UPI0008E3A839|nr:histidine phosphatase family protein [Butyrivibrio sp. INlla21]SFV05009.1 Broad specificity phosphatase PhoE [Butyrivibrio sp. INlla21]
MKVVIIRHGVVDYKMSRRCNSEEFDQDVKRYDEAPILPMEYHVPTGDYKSYYVSSLSRTLATARDIFGDKEYISTELLDEVPLSSSIKTNKRLPLAFWKISSRLQWLFNSKRPKEGKKDTVIRANKFIDDLIEKNEDCAVVSRGFFMITLLSEMKKRGFAVEGKNAGFTNGECVIVSMI